MRVLPPRSSAFVAAIEPAPALVMRKTLTQSHAEAEPTDSVAAFVVGPLDCAPLGALEVPVVLRAPLIVVVVPCGNSNVFPLPTVMEAWVFAPLNDIIPFVLLLLIVRLP